MGRVKKDKAAVVQSEPIVTQPTLHLVGAGGVGFWLAVGLARSGVRPVVVYDTDDLNGGLGHMRLPVASPATLKVNLLRGFLAVNFPGARMGEITFKSQLFTGKEVNAGDVVVDASDMSGEARRKIYKAVKQRKARYLRVSYDGAMSVVAIAEGLPLVGDESHAGYAAVPSLALSLFAGGAGAEVIAKTDWATKDFVEFQISLAELAGFPVVEPVVEEAAA
jgi:hypothetical protein